MSIGTAIRKLIGGSDSPNVKRKRGRRGSLRSARKAEKPRVTTLREMEAKLSRVISQGSAVHAGQIQLLGLEEIKHKLGDSWPRLEKRVKATARSAIENHLARQDFYFERSDMEYLVVFATKNVEQARLTSGAILDSLLQKFSGDHDLEDIIVRSAIGETDGKLNFDSKPLDVVVRTTRAERRDLKLSGPSSPPGDTSSAKKPAPSRPAAASASDSPAKATSASAPVRGRPAPSTIRKAPAKSPHRMTKLEPPKRVSFTEKAPNQQDELPEAITPAFKPVWDSARQGVTAFQVDAAIETGNQTIPTYRAAIQSGDGAFIRRLDVQILAAVSELLQAKPTATPQPYLIIPAHYESLHNARVGSDYVRHCRQHLTGLNHKIIFALKGLPSGLPSWRLVEIISNLKPISSNIVAFVDPDKANLPALGAAGLLMVAADLDIRAMPHSREYDKFRTLISAAARAGLQTFLFGVDEPAPGLFATTSDAKFVAGKIIGDPSSLPSPAYPIKKDSLIQKCAVACKKLAEESGSDQPGAAKSV